MVLHLLLSLFVAVAQAHIEEPCEPVLVQEQPDPKVHAAYAFANKVNPDRLRSHIAFISGDKALWGGVRLEERSNKLSREIARLSIAEHLRQLGYSATFETFLEGANVVVEIPGLETPDEILEIGAHYDAVETGADDNGAGVALVLHLAELFRHHPPGRTVRLIFHDLEEVDGAGARHHARQLENDPRKLIGVLIVDAIGYFPKHREPVIVAEVGDREDNLPLAREIFYQLRRLPVDRGLKVASEIHRIDPEAADHGVYWEEDQPAILMARPYGSQFENPYNHGPKDTIKNMNWDYYVQAARLITEVVGYSARVRMTAAPLAEENLSFRFAVEGQNLPAPAPPPPPAPPKRNQRPEKPGSGFFGLWGLFFGDDD